MLRKAVFLFAMCFAASSCMAKADHQKLDVLESSCAMTLTAVMAHVAYSGKFYSPKELLSNELRLDALQKESQIKVSGAISRITKRYDGKIQIEWKLPDTESKSIVSVFSPILNAKEEIAELNAGDKLEVICKKYTSGPREFVLSDCFTKCMFIVGGMEYLTSKLQNGEVLDEDEKNILQTAVRMSTILRPRAEEACSNVESCISWMEDNADMTIDSMTKDLTHKQKMELGQRCKELSIE